MRSEIITLCAKMFGVTPKDLMGMGRANEVIQARFALCAALRMRGWSYPRIGAFMRRDHTTIMHAVKRAEYIMERSREYEEKVETLSMWQPEIVKVSER